MKLNLMFILFERIRLRLGLYVCWTSKNSAGQREERKAGPREEILVASPWRKASGPIGRYKINHV